MLRQPPLTPDAKQAQEWLAHELSKGKYGRQPGVIERLLNWLFGDGRSPNLKVLNLPPVMLVIGLIVILAAIGFGATRMRRRGGRNRAASEEAGVLAEVTASATELRRSAEQAARRGDYAAAVLDRFRAIARRSEERALLPPRPGTTAREVGDSLAGFFPGHREDLRGAARVFDDVRYGGRAASAADAERLAALDRQLDAARPVHAVPEVTG
ncbi:DUF4129 domain-containing protein [Calidifontibacter sp. DB0510]|uniref:DUF4129 domain-containing protein n=1 Tax=Metallococcus carri TaxID=1656884 RepID=A0A967B6L8_9MICO|nr:DUF4129 domain-containing protein [Metallococcus carri]NHN56532.1 DUF4129 domain-containing protein [Metallococcus carri]NOP38831.1 DUF4129 domain-containing protein [Calidifontibacter sp. DB2511S]